MQNISSIEEIIMEIPMIDCHCHVTDPRIWKNSVDVRRNACNSQFCNTLIDLAGVSVFERAGMTMEEQDNMRYGVFEAEECINTVMKYMPDVEFTHHVAFL